MLTELFVLYCRTDKTIALNVLADLALKKNTTVYQVTLSFRLNLDVGDTCQNFHLSSARRLTLCDVDD